jgi:hypothetical protein
MACIGLADAKQISHTNNQNGHVMHTVFFLFPAKSFKPYQSPHEEQVISIETQHHDQAVALIREGILPAMCFLSFAPDHFRITRASYSQCKQSGLILLTDDI